MAGNGGGIEINLGFSRFALVGIMGTRITRIGRIYADFSLVNPPDPRYPRPHYSYERASAKINPLFFFAHKKPQTGECHHQDNRQNINRGEHALPGN